MNLSRLLIKLFTTVFAVLALAWVAPIAAQSDEELLRLKGVDRKCLEARKAKLRELQRQKVEECLREPTLEHADKKTRGECERYWSDYGWGAGKPGARSERFFENIPECTAANRAHEEYRKAE